MSDFNDYKADMTNDFQLVFDDCSRFVSGYFNNTFQSTKTEFLLDSKDIQLNGSSRPSISPQRNGTFQIQSINEEEEEEEAVEPSLLDELEIYPEQIKEKAMIMINPFTTDQLTGEKFLAETDLSGPIFFCTLFGACLFLAGKMYIFSHMYGLSMMSVLGMYGLLKLLNIGYHDHFITIKGVASALGYGMLHLVWLAFIGIFVHLNTMNGLIFAIPAVLMSTLGASRMLTIMSNQHNKGPLIAYPTAMIYILCTFLVAF